MSCNYSHNKESTSKKDQVQNEFCFLQLDFSQQGL